MIWKRYFSLEGKHAFIGASKSSWLNYDDEHLVMSYMNYVAKERGTRLHALASELIELKQKLPRSNKTLNHYVNDAIGFGMRTEQQLRYSDNCFGTADAIAFNEETRYLRIHDLKTGTIPAHIEQLRIYAALFCLDYNIPPTKLSGIELRIYQNDDVVIDKPEAEDILVIMDKIKHFDLIVEKLKEEQ